MSRIFKIGEIVRGIHSKQLYIIDKININDDTCYVISYKTGIKFDLPLRNLALTKLIQLPNYLNK